jgi:SAM-dependent methyltransferase
MKGPSRFDYSGEFGSHYHAGRSLPKPAEAWISSVRADKFRYYVSPNHRVLEYGVGFGWNLAGLRCAEKVGFDLAGNLAEAVEEKGIRFITSINLLCSGSRFDTIIAHHVLEHVSDPISVLRLLKTLISPNGKLLLHVPFEREGRYRRWRIERAHHLYSWTPESLRRIAEASGWSVESLRVDNFRFDRLASVIALRIKGGYGTYRFVRWLGRTLLPEYEIFLVGV